MLARGVFFCKSSFYLFFLSSIAVDLLGLLKWNSMVGKLKDILVTVMKVSGEEIVKVCSPIQLCCYPSVPFGRLASHIGGGGDKR